MAEHDVDPEVLLASSYSPQSANGSGLSTRPSLAGAASTLEDTVGRALDFLEGIGLIRRHHMVRCDVRGVTTQDVTFYELRKPPEPDPQTAGDRAVYWGNRCRSGFESRRNSRFIAETAARKNQMADFARQGKAPVAADRLVQQPWLVAGDWLVTPFARLG